MRLSPLLLALLLLLVAFTAGAQTIGNYTFLGNGSALNQDTPYTVVDLNSPATEAGTIGTVSVRSSRFDCTDGFKLKFFRRSGNTLTSIDERGPFSLNGTNTTVQLVPPVTVKRNDLLGVVALDSCMSVAGQTPVLSAEAIQFQGDAGTANLSTGTRLPLFALAAYGAQSPTAEIRMQTILVAGAATGVNGAKFLTDVFLTAPPAGISHGRLVYHREATTGFDDDVSVTFDVEPRNSKTIANIIGSSLGLSGKGSIDIYTKIGFEPPIAAARIYDDAGSAGTKGFSFDALKITDALGVGEDGILFTPQNTARFRMNIGIRTLDFPTQIDFALISSTGIQRSIVTRTYPANYFVQPDATSLLGLATQPGDTINIFPIDGPVFVYGSIIDNTTNDPSLQIARAVR